MAVTYTCGQCQGARFPEGMYVYHCSACQTHIHPGCWEAHVTDHRQHGDITSDHLEPRRGKISAYGIIQWDNK
jgi:hypothetical protein